LTTVDEIEWGKKDLATDETMTFKHIAIDAHQTRLPNGRDRLKGACIARSLLTTES
jgi:hypothetical protein